MDTGRGAHARSWFVGAKIELELEPIQPHMAQKPMLRGEVGCACVAREVSVERGGMGENYSPREGPHHSQVKVIENYS